MPYLIFFYKVDVHLNGVFLVSEVYGAKVISEFETYYYIRATEGEWKRRYYKHMMSVNNRIYKGITDFSLYVGTLLTLDNESPTTRSKILAKLCWYTNVLTKVFLMLREKFLLLQRMGDQLLIKMN